MTGDSDNEFDSVGETPAPPAAEPKAGDERAPSRRAFRAWSSAQPEEGVLDKIGKRISGIFSKPAAPPPAAIETSASSSDLELIMPEPVAEEPMAFDVIPDSEPIAAADIIPPAVEKPKRPSLIARLFGMKQEDPAPAIESFELQKDDASELLASAPDEEPMLQAAVPDEEPTLHATAPDEGPTLQAAVPDEEPTLHATAPDEEPTLHATAPEDDSALHPPPMEEPTTEPIPQSVGLFGRLFSRKPKVSRPIPMERPAEIPAEMETQAEIEPTLAEMPAVEAIEPPIADEELVRTDEHAMPAHEESPVDAASSDERVFLEQPVESEQPVFASVEEALPAEPESTVDLIEAALAEPLLEEERKPGFFARLFGRKSKPEQRPSLEIEFHEDRVEAAAHALDEVSGESFAGETQAVESESYASVDEALPLEEPPAEADVAPVAELDAVDMRFAPPPVMETVEPPVAADSRSTLELQPFDPFAETLDPSRDTVETTPPDSRSTLEMAQQEPRSTEEIALEAELRGEIAASDVNEKTDEFAIPSVDTEATTGELIETDTTQAAKMTWWMRLLGRKPKDEAAKSGLPAGTVVEGNPNFLFSKFKAFYNEIIRFKHQKTEFAAGFSTAILTDFNADLSPDAAASAQSQALHQMLELQAAEAQWMGGEAKDRYPDAQYAMAAMADELFSHMEWDGQAAWKNHLLEVKLYRSHAADIELFKRIDKLLKEQPNSHVARDLARVYLLVLAAGFQGKYRPFGLPRALAQYRQRLYEYIHQGDSLMLYAQDRRIFPEAASRTLEGHAVGRFSSLQRWAAILVFLVLGYTVLAHYAWNRVSADLKDVTERIRAASSTTGSATSPTSSNSTAANGGAR